MHDIKFDHTQFLVSENPSITGEAVFTLVSIARDTDPPVFTLSFNVTDLPPSTVTCDVDNTALNIPDEDIDRCVIEALYPNLKILVMTTVRSRQSGSYDCTVSTGINGVGSETSMAVTITGQYTYSSKLDVIILFLMLITIIVTDYPSDFEFIRIGFKQANLSWSPASNDPIVEGYEVFYDLTNGTRISEDVGNTTMIEIDTLDPELSYSAFVVAYGGDLPSAASDHMNIDRGNEYT